MDIPLTWVVLFLVGAVLGWLVAIAERAKQRPAMVVAAVLVGAVGAISLGALVITPALSGAIPLSGFSLPAFLLALLGAILPLMLWYLFAKRRR